MIIFISGSESTGKTELAKALSELYNVPWVPEYARGYIENMNRPYNAKDVENIAREQLKQIAQHQYSPLVFFDTGLVITKLWFQTVYDMVPEWFSRLYPNMAKGRYLLCYPDLPWEPDPVRENGDKRMLLHAQYELEILKLAALYATIKGRGEMRLLEAVKALESWGYKINKSNNGN